MGLVGVEVEVHGGGVGVLVVHWWVLSGRLAVRHEDDAVWIAGFLFCFFLF